MRNSCFVYDERLASLILFLLFIISLSFHEATMNYYCKLCSGSVVWDAGSLWRSYLIERVVNCVASLNLYLLVPPRSLCRICIGVELRCKLTS